VRVERLVRRGPARTGESRGLLDSCALRAFVGVQVAAPHKAVCAKRDRMALIGEPQLRILPAAEASAAAATKSGPGGEGQRQRRIMLARGGGKRGRKPFVIESGPFRGRIG